MYRPCYTWPAARTSALTWSYRRFPCVRSSWPLRSVLGRCLPLRRARGPAGRPHAPLVRRNVDQWAATPGGGRLEQVWKV